MPACSRSARRIDRGAGASRGDGVYVDATFGRGGHARAILASLGPARPARRRRSRSRRRTRPLHAIDGSTFRFPPRVVLRICPTCSTRLRIAHVDGVLLDLGVSSPQLDDAARGFSLSHRRSARHADGSVARRDAQPRSSPAPSMRELTEVIRDYGEERFAQSVARAIAKAREIAADRHDTAACARRCASRRRAHAG